LCRQALTAPDEDLESVFTELKLALREHTERLRKLLTIKLVQRNGDHPPDRRSA
jgi:hypothetical protein